MGLGGVKNGAGNALSRHLSLLRRGGYAGNRRIRRRALVLTIVQILQFLITVYIYVLIAAAILSWLIAFDIVNRYNQYARMFSVALYRLT